MSQRRHLVQLIEVLSVKARLSLVQDVETRRSIVANQCAYSIRVRQRTYEGVDTVRAVIVARDTLPIVRIP
jgi:hypothetical protein